MTDRAAPARSVLAIVLSYGVFAALWLLLSDTILAWLVGAPAGFALASLLKGWLFVAVTSFLLYVLLRRRSAEAPTAAVPGRWLRLPLALVGLVIIALTGAGIAYTVESQRDKEVARLQAIADLQARQVSDWLAERLHDAGYAKTSGFFAEQYRLWRHQGDQAAGARLQTRLEQLRASRGFSAVMLLDAGGNRAWGTAAAASEPAPPLRAAAVAAAQDGKVHWVGPYRGPAGHVRLDFIAPLTALAGPHPLIVLEVNPADWLFPTLQAWPVPSRSGETSLFRRDGGQVQFLNELRHRRDTAARLQMPLAAREGLAAQVARDEVPPGGVVSGRDYRGLPAMGVVRAIAGTDWFLVAKMDRAELYEVAYRDSAWIALAGLLALFMAATAMIVLRQHQQLALAAAIQQEQADKLRATQLLDAVATASEDAIFVVDRDSRFLLFNAACEQFTGRPAREVIGLDETVLFPAELARRHLAENELVMASGKARTYDEAIPAVVGERIFQIYKAPLRDADGQVIGLFCIARDVTERKQSEQALRESEARYHALYENSLDAVLLTMPDGHILAANPAAQGMFGYSWAELRELGREALVDASDPRLAAALAERARTGRFSGELTMVRRDGSRFEVELSSLVFQDQDGRELTSMVVRDISARKASEAALRESEGRFRALVEQALAGIYIIQDGRFRYVNPGFAAIFGFGSPEELIDRVPVADLVGPEDRARVEENIRQRIEGDHEDIHYTFTGLCRDGRRIEVEVHGRVFEYRGRPAVIGLILDVTARKAAEDALRESELRFHDIVRASADWVWEVDAEGRYTYASDSVHDLLGYTPAELIDKTPFDLMPTEEAARVAAIFADLAARRAPFRDLDNLTRHKDGSLCHVQSNGMPILDQDGRLLGYRGLDRDVTAAKLAERQLGESETRFRTLFDNAAVAIMVHDRETGAILDANRQAIESYGYATLAELQANDFWLEPPYSAEAAMALIRKTAEEGPQRFEWLSRDRSGRLFWEDVQLQRITLGGVERVISISTDISERKAAEEELRQRNAELERFNRATVGRELDMIELKKEVNDLARQLGRAPPYPLAFLEERGDRT